MQAIADHIVMYDNEDDDNFDDNYVAWCENDNDGDCHNSGTNNDLNSGNNNGDDKSNINDNGNNTITITDNHDYDKNSKKSQ